MRKEKPLNKESLIKAFKCFDTNGDGYITYDELFGLLTKVLCASLARDMNVWIVYIFNKWQLSCSTAVSREPLLYELESAFLRATHAQGGYLGFEVTGVIEGFFLVWHFQFWDFLGTKIWLR